MDGRRGLARRDVLTATSLGITTVALPSATAAASGLSFVPSAASYSENDVVVAGWLPFASDDEASYSGDGVAATTVAGLTAHLKLGGTTISYGNLNPVDPEITGEDDTTSQSSWVMRNSSSTLDLANSPHLEFSVSVTSGTLSLATFVLHSIRNQDTPSGSALNLAAYVSTDGFATSVLRRTARVEVADSNSHIVVNLGLSAQTFTSGSVAVRVFPFATPTARDVRLNRYNSDPAPQPLDGSVDTLVPSVVNTAIGGTQDWIAAFVGTLAD